MVLFIFFILVIDGVLDGAVDLTAAAQDAFDLFLAVIDGLHVETVVITGCQRIKDGDQTTNCIIHRGEQFTIGRSLFTACQILAATHSEVELHVLPPQGLVEQFFVTAL